MDRVVALVDMDCFYVQVEQRVNPELKGKPCAVVQYNPWKGGGIIAVGYEARACGVTRNMRGDDAKAVCADIRLVPVPQVRGKADLTKYRTAGAEVITVLSQFSECVERASVDEAYIDITEEAENRLKSLYEKNESLAETMLPNTHIIEYDDKDKYSSVENVDIRRLSVESWLNELNSDSEDRHYDKLMAIGGILVEEMRAAVFEQTGFRCSAGVAANKMLAKLVCGLHKPNKQSILPQSSVTSLFNKIPVKKVRNLGGKLGQSIVEQLGCEMMSDLTRISQLHLENLFGEKTGTWLYGVCRGIDHDPVNPRQLPKSIGCSKNFQGKAQLDTKSKVKHWLFELATEIEERLIKDREQNKRKAQTMTVSIQNSGKLRSSGVSRSYSLVTYDKRVFADTALILLKEFNTGSSQDDVWLPPVAHLGLSAGKFKDVVTSTSGLVSISKFLSQTQSSTVSVTQPPVSQQLQKRTALTLSELWSPNRSQIVDKKQNLIDETDNGVVYRESADVTLCAENSDCDVLFELHGDEDHFSKVSPTSDTVSTHNKCAEFLAANYQKSITTVVNKSNDQSRTDQRKCSESLPLDGNESQSGIVADSYTGDNSLSSDSTGFFASRLNKYQENCDSNASSVRNYCESSNESGFFATKMRELISKKDHPGPTFPEALSFNEKANERIETEEHSIKNSKLGLIPASTVTKTEDKHSKSVFDNSMENFVKLAESSKSIGEASACTSDTRQDSGKKSMLSHLTMNDSKVANEKFDSSDYMICKTCRKEILIWDMPEHNDFHFAMEIQNQPMALANANKSNTCTASSSVKRKSSDSNGKKSKKSKSSNKSNNFTSLDQFFKPK